MVATIPILNLNEHRQWMFVLKVYMIFYKKVKFKRLNEPKEVAKRQELEKRRKKKPPLGFIAEIENPAHFHNFLLIESGYNHWLCDYELYIVAL